MTNVSHGFMAAFLLPLSATAIVWLETYFTDYFLYYFSRNQTKVCIIFSYLYNPSFNFYLLGNNMCLFFSFFVLFIGENLSFPCAIGFVFLSQLSDGHLLAPCCALVLLSYSCLPTVVLKVICHSWCEEVWRYWLPRAEVIRVPVISKVPSFESWDFVLSCG